MLKSKPKTLCGKCVHHVQEYGVPDVWHSHTCVHPNEKHVWWDCVGGQKHIEFPYCRDVNNGNCPHYTPKRKESQ